MITSLNDLAQDLAARRTTSRDLVEVLLDRIASSEDGPAYLTNYPDAARRMADAMDQARAHGAALPPLAGIPVSVKDLFDLEGEVTLAASRALTGSAPARVDAEAVRRLKRAGLIVLGKTNMTEFAFSGLGVNPHFGTPRNPTDPEVVRVPGGSSSGAGVTVAAGLAAAALGTDTGGSCRIPAAFCGVVGFKPTQNRVPRMGVFALSRSLDCVGPVARTVSCCARLDDMLAGGFGADVAPTPIAGTRLGRVTNYVTADLDPEVTEAFEAACARLEAAGVRMVPLQMPEFDEMPRLNANGGIVGIEAFSRHRERIAASGALYDPFVRSRITFSEGVSAADYIDLLEARARIRRSVAARAGGVDAVLMPTVACLAPKLSDVEDPDAAREINRLCLRNTAIANFLDVPAVTIPCQAPDALPVGLMLMGASGGDRPLLSLAAGLEAVIRGTPAQA
ncbi:MAG: amidase [Pseudomonadota bacterium]